MTKKLIYICGNETLKKQALDYLNADHDDIVLQNNISVLLQPFGSVVKSMLVSAFKENVSNVYIVAPGNDSYETDENEVRQWLLEQGVENKTLQLFNYLDQYDRQSLNDWLKIDSTEETLAKNIQMLNAHPLLPKHLVFTGIINNNNRKFKVLNN